MPGRSKRCSVPGSGVEAIKVGLGVRSATVVQAAVESLEQLFVVDVLQFDAREDDVVEAAATITDAEIRVAHAVKDGQLTLHEASDGSDALLAVQQPARHVLARTVAVPVLAVDDVVASAQTKEDAFDEAHLLLLIPDHGTLPFWQHQVEQLALFVVGGGCRRAFPEHGDGIDALHAVQQSIGEGGVSHGVLRGNGGGSPRLM